MSATSGGLGWAGEEGSPGATATTVSPRAGTAVMVSQHASGGECLRTLQLSAVSWAMLFSFLHPRHTIDRCVIDKLQNSPFLKFAPLPLGRELLGKT